MRHEAGQAVFWLVMTVLLVVVAAVIFIAQDEDEVEPSGHLIANIVEQPERFLGETVTVSGEVGEVAGERAFTLGGDKGVAGSRRILVISREPIERIDEAGADSRRPFYDELVKVAGTVRRLDHETTGKGLGIDSRTLERFSGEPVIVASDVVHTPREKPPEAGPTAEDLVEKPERYLGQLVTLSTIVERQIAPHALLTREGLVIFMPTHEAEKYPPGHELPLTGTFRRLDVSRLEDDINIDVEDREALSKYEGRPAVIRRR